MAEVDDLAAVIEADMIRNYGGEENLSSDPGSRIRARIYANAVEYAHVELSSRGAGRQFIPAECTDLISKLEWENKLIPQFDDDLPTRQSAVAVAAKLSAGATRPNIEAVLTDLLGADFIAYITPDKSVAFSPPTDPATTGNWVRPGYPAFVGKITGEIVQKPINAAVTIPYVKVAGRDAPLEAGETILIDPGWTRPERATLLSVTSTTLTALFTKSHAGGVLFTTARCPIANTSLRGNTVVLTPAAARDAETRRKVHNVMGKLLRGVSRWAIVEQTSPGLSGPFRPGVGLPGLTALNLVLPIVSVGTGAVAANPSSTPLFSANATSTASHGSSASCSPSFSANATGRSLRAGAPSSAPTFSANLTRAGYALNSAPTLTANATSSALKAAAPSSAPSFNANATSHALKQAAPSSAPTLNAAATGHSG